MLSQKSIGRIEHNKKKFKIIMNKEYRKSVMRFAFIDSLKSCCFKRNRESHNFLITFRKHLLSEEHLFKNHIKILSYIGISFNERLVVFAVAKIVFF